MLGLLRRRLIHLILVLLLVSFFTTLLLELTPGDPALALLGDTATPEQVAAVHEELGLDQPLLQRYVEWVGNAVTGDLGVSFQSRQPVWDAIRTRLPVDIELALVTVFVSLLIAIPLGVLSAHRQGSWLDRATNAFSSAMLSSPDFLTALVLVFLFAVTLNLLPVTGWVPLSEDLFENLRHLALPVLALVVRQSAIFLRLLRNDMIATLQEDYLLAARAKGLPTRQILFRHALRPSSFSLVTVAGISLGQIVGGLIIVETIFALPGIGQYMIQAIYNKDLIAVQGAVLFVAAAYVVVSTVVELAYAWLDPRVRARPT